VFNICEISSNTYTFSGHTLWFTILMPSGWVFILFCVLLRMTEGFGSAMLGTAAFALQNYSLTTLG